MLDSAIAVCENCASGDRAERLLEDSARMDKVNLVYMDDSEQAGRFQVIGAVIIHDSRFGEVEQMLGLTILDLVPEDLKDDFEFHACDLLNGNEPFQNVSTAAALAIFSRAVETIEVCKVSVVYGAVDLKKLHASVYSSANAVDIAFRLCAQRVEQWFEANANSELGLMISDDTSNKHIKSAMQNRFRMLRKRLVKGTMVGRGPLAHMHDDMYFGDSRFSSGLQLADICSLLISRHLVGALDTEALYQRLSKSIFSSNVNEPEPEDWSLWAA